jgi:hypothetical protein
MAGKHHYNRLKLEKAYAEGREASANGALIGTNPHPSGSDEESAWNGGFASDTNDPAGADSTVHSPANVYGANYTP